MRTANLPQVRNTEYTAHMSPRKATKKPKVMPPPEPPVLDEPVPGPANRTKWYIALAGGGMFLLVFGALFAFSGDMPGWEQSAFRLINDMTTPSWVTNQLAKPFSNAVWGMVGLVVVLLAVPKFRFRAWQYAVAAGSAYALVAVLEQLVGRGRPADLPYHVVLRAMQDGPGFPSGHVAVITALGLTIWPLVTWPWRILIVVLVGAEAWSRVFLGVHAPLDVVGGIAVGMIVVGAIHLLPPQIKHFFRLSR